MGQSEILTANPIMRTGKDSTIFRLTFFLNLQFVSENRPLLEPSRGLKCTEDPRSEVFDGTNRLFHIGLECPPPLPGAFYTLTVKKMAVLVQVHHYKMYFISLNNHSNPSHFTTSFHQSYTNYVTVTTSRMRCKTWKVKR